jgi:hypothetical protein
MTNNSAVAVIRVKRRKSLIRGALAQLFVVIDGERVGRTRPGRESDYAVAPGEHRVLVTGRTSRHPTSNEVDVPLEAGQLTEIECRFRGLIGRRSGSKTPSFALQLEVKG